MSDTDNKLLALLYILMRDHLPVGVIPQILNELGEQSYSFSNAHLAEYADELVDRLLPVQEEGSRPLAIHIQPPPDVPLECVHCAFPLTEKTAMKWGVGVVCWNLRDCVARQKSIHLQTGGQWK